MSKKTLWNEHFMPDTCFIWQEIFINLFTLLPFSTDPFPLEILEATDLKS
jgi:hypothetical protein